MPTTTTGIFFLSKQRPEALDKPEGFTLKLQVIDRQGLHRVEAYTAMWPGESARAWWAAHSGIQPGQPLRMTLNNPRSYPGARSTYIEGTVAQCELAPHSTASHTQQAHHA